MFKGNEELPADLKRESFPLGNLNTIIETTGKEQLGTYRIGDVIKTPDAVLTVKGFTEDKAVVFNQATKMYELHSEQVLNAMQEIIELEQ